jgi:hypothetical protein
MYNVIPCPAPDCEEGTVYVNNAYAPDPLKPEAQVCVFCSGQGFVLTGESLAVAN